MRSPGRRGASPPKGSRRLRPLRRENFLAPACSAPPHPPPPGPGLAPRGAASCSGFWGLKRPPWPRPGTPGFEAPALGAPKGRQGQGFETEAFTPKIRFLVLMPAACRWLMLEREARRSQIFSGCLPSATQCSQMEQTF